MAFQISFGAASLCGRRPRNEDCVAVAGPASDPPLTGDRLLAAIADGVSSGGGGMVAAQLSVSTLLADFAAAPDTWSASTALDRILTAQNAWLHGQNVRSPADAQMATTLTALLFDGHTWSIAHVGDSRACRIRDRKVEPLTTDHVRGGGYSGVLTRALGIDEHLALEHVEGDVRIQDLYLLMTDGAWNRLRHADLTDLAGNPAPCETLARQLAQLAFDRGSTDNITVAVLRVEGLPTADLRAEHLRARDLDVPRALRPGESVDGLRVEAAVHVSAVTCLYRVVDDETGRTLALKTLAAERADDPDERANLVHEGWLAARLPAPHFVAIVDRPGASHFYRLFEWHEGRTLEAMLRAGHRFEVPQIIDVGRQLLQALSALHRRGVIHRDIKPENLLLGTDGVLRIIDLGVAVSGNEPRSLLDLHAGTPSYMEPQQWDGARASSRSDLYAAGVTLYRLLTGRLPFGEVLPYQTGRFRRDPPSVTRSRPDVPKWLDALVLKAIQLSPDGRFETAEEFLLALERGAARPLLPPPRTPWLSTDRGGLQVALAVSLLVNLALLVLLLLVGR